MRTSTDIIEYDAEDDADLIEALIEQIIDRLRDDAIIHGEAPALIAHIMAGEYLRDTYIAKPN